MAENEPPGSPPRNPQNNPEGNPIKPLNDDLPDTPVDAAPSQPLQQIPNQPIHPPPEPPAEDSLNDLSSDGAPDVPVDAPPAPPAQLAPSQPTHPPPDPPIENATNESTSDRTSSTLVDAPSSRSSQAPSLPVDHPPSDTEYQPPNHPPPNRQASVRFTTSPDPNLPNFNLELPFRLRDGPAGALPLPPRSRPIAPGSQADAHLYPRGSLRSRPPAPPRHPFAPTFTARQLGLPVRQIAEPMPDRPYPLPIVWETYGPEEEWYERIQHFYNDGLIRLDGIFDLGWIPPPPLHVPGWQFVTPLVPQPNGAPVAPAQRPPPGANGAPTHPPLVPPSGANGNSNHPLQLPPPYAPRQMFSNPPIESHYDPDFPSAAAAAAFHASRPPPVPGLRERSTNEPPRAARGAVRGTPPRTSAPTTRAGPSQRSTPNARGGSSQRSPPTTRGGPSQRTARQIREEEMARCTVVPRGSQRSDGTVVPPPSDSWSRPYRAGHDHGESDHTIRSAGMRRTVSQPQTVRETTTDRQGRSTGPRSRTVSYGDVTVDENVIEDTSSEERHANTNRRSNAPPGLPQGWTAHHHRYTSMPTNTGDPSRAGQLPPNPNLFTPGSMLWNLAHAELAQQAQQRSMPARTRDPSQEGQLPPDPSLFTPGSMLWHLSHAQLAQNRAQENLAQAQLAQDLAQAQQARTVPGTLYGFGPTTQVIPTPRPPPQHQHTTQNLQRLPQHQHQHASPQNPQPPAQHQHNTLNIQPPPGLGIGPSLTPVGTQIEPPTGYGPQNLPPPHQPPPQQTVPQRQPAPLGQGAQPPAAQQIAQAPDSQPALQPSAAQQIAQAPNPQPAPQGQSSQRQSSREHRFGSIGKAFRKFRER